MKITLSAIHHVIFLALLLFMGCGSAAEFSDAEEVLQHDDYQSAPEKIGLAEYDVTFDASDVSLSFTPTLISSAKVLERLLPYGKAANENQFLENQIITAATFGSGCSASTYDNFSNAIRIYNETDTRACCLTQTTGQTANGLGINIFNITPASVVFSQGASSNFVAYGDIPSGISSCRSLKITATDSSAWTSTWRVEASSLDETSPSYIAYSTVNWSYSGASLSVSINGSGFKASGNTLSVGGTSVAIGTETTDAITATINYAVGSGTDGGGILTVGANRTLYGPYVVQPARTNLSVRLHAGGTNGDYPIYIYWKSSGSITTIQGCPSGPQDGQFSPNVSLSTTLAAVRNVNYSTISGGGIPIGIWVDYDRSGTLNNGDRYTTTAQTVQFNTAATIPVVTVNSTISGVPDSGVCP